MTTTDQIIAWQGVTGAGNTYALSALVSEIEPDGRAKVIDAEGKTRAIDLTGKQPGLCLGQYHLQQSGQTANRVLALLENTTHRETFYVALSRAKHELMLHTSSRKALMRLAQVSRAEENVSDHVP